jgi:UDP-glucose 4-epimerase
MRILITGGAGFIGSNLADEALAQGHQVAILDDLSTGRRENVPVKATFFEGDIRNASKVTEIFAAFQPEIVCHQAAQTSVVVSTREPIRDAEINVIGSLQLIQASVAHKVQRFVFASTGGAIYGEIAEGRRAKEDEMPLPLSPYACSKFAVEGYLRAAGFEHGLKSTVLRYANVYGPRQDPHGEAGVVAIFAERLKAKQPIQINAKQKPGDDGCVRDYVFVGDVVRANMAAIQGAISAPIMNVCTGDATTTKMLADQLEKQLGAGSERRVGPKRPGDVERSVLDPSLCASIIGAKTSIEEGLALTARWFKDR